MANLDSASSHSISPAMMLAYRIYGISYILAVIFLYSHAVTAVSIQLGGTAGNATKVFLAIVGILGIVLAAAPARFYRIAASPFYLIFGLMTIFGLLKYVIPAFLSFALALFELSVFLLVI